MDNVSYKTIKPVILLPSQNNRTNLLKVRQLLKIVSTGKVLTKIDNWTHPINHTLATNDICVLAVCSLLSGNALSIGGYILILFTLTVISKWYIQAVIE